MKNCSRAGARDLAPLSGFRRYVYFARFTNDTVKIGISHDLNQRMKALQLEARCAGIYLGRIELNARAARVLERAIHRQLGPFWLRGEWYRDCVEVRQEIHRLTRDRKAVQAILDRVRRAEILVRRPSPFNVRVIARVARDIVVAAPECPEGELAELVKQRCARHHIPYDTDSVAKALRAELWKVRVGR